MTVKPRVLFPVVLRAAIAPALLATLVGCGPTHGETGALAVTHATMQEPAAPRVDGELPPEWEAELTALIPEAAIIPDTVEIGLGSGREGLATTTVNREGVATVYRTSFGSPEWQRATVHLSLEEHAAIIERIHHDQIYATDGRYSSGLMDGTQLVLRLVEGDDQTIVYCDNNCPDEVNRFYEEFVRIVDNAGRDRFRWEWVSGSEHDDALWEAVRTMR